MQVRAFERYIPLKYFKEPTDRNVHDLWWTKIKQYLLPKGMCGNLGHFFQQDDA